MNILIIDNFDSFTKNIAQYVYEACGNTPRIIPNTTTLHDIGLTAFQAIIISPGPGHPACPADFGVCHDILASSLLPILGICLGHQGINLFYGGKVENAPEPVHGYRASISHSGRNLFHAIAQDFNIVRYHSFVCTSVPACLKVTARSSDGLVMAIEHRTRPIYGVQFHPESIDSECGHQIIQNFLRLAKQAHGPLCEGLRPMATLRAALNQVGAPKDSHARSDCSMQATTRQLRSKLALPTARPLFG